MSKTIIESDKVTVKAEQKIVFEYLNDFNNIKNLLPEDKISDWESSVDHCSFKVQNAATIPLNKESVEEYSRINIVSGEKAPFPFTLYILLEDIGNETTGFLHFEGDINMFLKMMVEKPLTNLFNYMANQLKKNFEH